MNEGSARRQVPEHRLKWLSSASQVLLPSLTAIFKIAK
jgi:hypothetical protein